MRLAVAWAGVIILLAASGLAAAQGDWTSAPPVAQDAAERRILDALATFTPEHRARYASVVPQNGRLLRVLAETAGARRIVEIGMSSGYSTLWLALAARRTGGQIITHEIDEARIPVARENFRRAGVEELITIVPGDAHEQVKKLQGPLDLVFIDADKEGYEDYVAKLLPLVRPGGLIIADNAAYPAPPAGFFKAVTTNPDLETVFLNMTSTGLSVSVRKR